MKFSVKIFLNLKKLILFISTPPYFSQCRLPVWLVHAAGTTHGYEALNWR